MGTIYGWKYSGIVREDFPLSSGSLMNDVTRILFAIERGDAHATEELLPLVYEELRKLAAQRLAKETPGQTLQATALVHEAHMRLVASGDRKPVASGIASAPREQHWRSRGHFFAAAAEAMRRILLDNARRKRTFLLHNLDKKLSAELEAAETEEKSKT